MWIQVSGNSTSEDLARDFESLSEPNRCPAVLVEFAQNRAILLITKPEARAKLVGQLRFWDSAAVERVIQKQVKRAFVFFYHFENPVSIFG